MTGLRVAGDLVAGTWKRTMVAVVLLVAVAAGVVVLAASGVLRHTNGPAPSRYVPNSFASSGGPSELVSTSEAARVKADIVQDGKIEEQAFATGNTALLSQADTGNSLAKVRQLLEANNAAGVIERQQVQLDQVVVGRLADPADSGVGVTWCVEERGSGTLTQFSKASGQLVQTQHLTFDNHFWLVRVGQRYLITDVEVR